MKLAIFDFDGTIYPKETFPLMMKYLKQHPTHHKRYQHFFIKVLPFFIAYNMKVYPERKMRNKAMYYYLASLRTISTFEMQQFFNQLGDKMADNLNEEVVQRIHQHKREGYYIMVVSGAFQPLLHAVLRDLPVDCIVGTEIPSSKRIPIDHVNGKRKIPKIMEQLQDQTIDWDHSFAYSDSYTDLDMLELVGNPIAVQPDSQLLEVATNRNWYVIHNQHV